MAGGKHVLGKPNGRHVFGTVKVGEKGQIVIPKEARELYGIGAGDALLVMGDDRVGLIVSKPDAIPDLASQIFQAMDQPE